MATKEENQKRLRQLAGLLGREADMSGSAADIAQRVSEWEEELAASRRALCLVMRAGLSKITQTMVSSCTTLMLRMMLKRSVCGNACM
ncbi:DNA packaging protein [Escherichia coli DEC12A]|nr:DNA packaging protein [Escherichia coli DEC12A]